MTFYVVPVLTLFLIYLKNIDNLGVKFDNLRNILIQERANRTKEIPIFRRFGYPWIYTDPRKTLVSPPESTSNRPSYSYLTATEILRIYRRFSYLSTQRFHKILKQANYNINYEELKRLVKYCEQYQKNPRTLIRFKFNVRDNNDFNYTIIVNIV